MDQSSSMDAMRYKLGLVQMHCVLEPEKNVEQAEQSIREAAAGGANVVVLPELFRAQYFCQSEDHAQFDLAEPIPGPTTERLSALAKKLGVVVIASIFERRAPGLYHNSAVVIDADGSIAGLYRKMHIPDDPLYYEKFYFTPGDVGFKSFATRFGSIGPLVCWDQWFPEGARVASLAGASLLVFPTAIGWHPSEKAEYGDAQRDAWRTIQRGHAIANGVYVAACNRVGHEGPSRGGIEFWGGSFVCDPFGKILCEASTTEPAILIAEVDLVHLEQVRRHWPFLRDRRIDGYGPVLQRYSETKSSE